MIDWNDAEQSALSSFIVDQGPLKSALIKFTRRASLDYKNMCAAAMSTVPRDPERGADYAAKAQVLDELWMLLEEEIKASLEVPSEEPTLRGMED